MTEVIREVKRAFGKPVYGEEAKQGTKGECFAVTVFKTEEKRLLGRRRQRKVTLCIRYYGEKGTFGKEAGNQVADGLYGILCLIGTDEVFAAGKMEHKEEADGIVFYVTYGYHILAEEEHPYMERLEYNGRKAVGYEERNTI